jgi:hypothetical protein
LATLVVEVAHQMVQVAVLAQLVMAADQELLMVLAILVLSIEAVALAVVRAQVAPEMEALVAQALLF